jgi:mRNA interferase MazF
VEIKRGDIVYMTDKEECVMRTRPYLIVSNDVGNRHSDIVLGTPLTTRMRKPDQPTHCIVGFRKSMVLAEQIVTIRKEDINRVVLHVDDMTEVDRCLMASLGIGGYDGSNVA